MNDNTALMKLPAMELTNDTFLPDRKSSRNPKQLARSYDSHSQTESYRATLSAEAMGHTAKLVSLANQISEKVPEAEQPCRSIALGYALSATARIMKF
jgi:hypothetical protein